MNMKADKSKESPVLSPGQYNWLKQFNSDEVVNQTHTAYAKDKIVKSHLGSFTISKTEEGQIDLADESIPENARGIIEEAKKDPNKVLLVKPLQPSQGYSINVFKQPRSNTGCKKTTTNIIKIENDKEYNKLYNKLVELLDQNQTKPNQTIVINRKKFIDPCTCECISLSSMPHAEARNILTNKTAETKELVFDRYNKDVSSTVRNFLLDENYRDIQNIVIVVKTPPKAQPGYKLSLITKEEAIKFDYNSIDKTQVETSTNENENEKINLKLVKQKANLRKNHHIETIFTDLPAEPFKTADELIQYTFTTTYNVLRESKNPIAERAAYIFRGCWAGSGVGPIVNCSHGEIKNPKTPHEKAVRKYQQFIINEAQKLKNNDPIKYRIDCFNYLQEIIVQFCIAIEPYHEKAYPPEIHAQYLQILASTFHQIVADYKKHVHSKYSAVDTELNTFLFNVFNGLWSASQSFNSTSEKK